MSVDDATWARGRGWSLSNALIALPYYKDTNPTLANNARHVIQEVITDNAVVREGIVAFNKNALGERDKAFSVFLKNGQGKVVGEMRPAEAVKKLEFWRF